VIRVSILGCFGIHCLGLVTFAVLSWPSCSSSAQAVSVRMHEGPSHGYIALRDAKGKIIASGEDIQNVHGQRIESRLVLHFNDGSIDDDTSIAEQGEVFRLISNHHIQKGPSFPQTLDVLIDTAAQQVNFVKDGTKETKSEHMDLPVGLSNGIFFTVIRNLKITGSEVEVPYLAVSSKPRLITLAISLDGTDRYRVAGASYKAMRYLVKIKLGGLSGAIAPAIGKDPGNFHIWVSSGPVPTVLRADGPLFDGGPVWSLQLASPTW
jgi:hypothetical protein